jgi:inner membrane protein
MDNLTHSLAGALIGQMGLKRKSGLGMAALIIGANLPDIDATCTIYGIESLAMRRGLTHGPVAMIVLPVLLTGALLIYNRWRPNADRLPVRPGWLYLLALIGTLSHPAMDWLNSYGIRLLEPFSSRWFYGDSIFIIDVWLWVIMIISIVLSRRREKAGHAKWRRPAAIGFDLACSYIFLNGVITGVAEAAAEKAIRSRAAHIEGKLTVVASPWPIIFFCRDILWRDEAVAGRTDYCLGQGLKVERLGLTEYHFMHSSLTASALRRARERNADVRAFLFWSRMPVLRQTGDKLILSDQRFDDPLVRGRFTVEVPR